MFIFAIMGKSQLDNLINFAFVFHRQMDNNWIDCDPDYILEKWNKIIGTKSDKLIFISEDYPIKNWKKRWNVTEEKYEEVKQIISFIRQLNLKPINNKDENTEFSPNKNWRPDDLVKIYEHNIGDPNLISKDNYDHIHELVKRAIGVYKHKYLREYNIILLV